MSCDYKIKTEKGGDDCEYKLSTEIPAYKCDITVDTYFEEQKAEYPPTWDLQKYGINFVLAVCANGSSLYVLATKLTGQGRRTYLFNFDVTLSSFDGGMGDITGLVDSFDVTDDINPNNGYPLYDKDGWYSMQMYSTDGASSDLIIKEVYQDNRYRRIWVFGSMLNLRYEQIGGLGTFLGKDNMLVGHEYSDPYIDTKGVITPGGPCRYKIGSNPLLPHNTYTFTDSWVIKSPLLAPSSVPVVDKQIANRLYYAMSPLAKEIEACVMNTKSGISAIMGDVTIFNGGSSYFTPKDKFPAHPSQTTGGMLLVYGSGVTKGNAGSSWCFKGVTPLCTSVTDERMHEIAESPADGFNFIGGDIAFDWDKMWLIPGAYMDDIITRNEKDVLFIQSKHYVGWSRVDASIKPARGSVLKKFPVGTGENWTSKIAWTAPHLYDTSTIKTAKGNVSCGVGGGWLLRPVNTPVDGKPDIYVTSIEQIPFDGDSFW